MFLICNSKIADLLDSKTVDETNVKYGSRSRGYLNRNHLKMGNLQIRILISLREAAKKTVFFNGPATKKLFLRLPLLLLTLAIKAVSNSPRELTNTATRAAAKCNDK